jgi:exopolysaccharide production protein ExoZ
MLPDRRQARLEGIEFSRGIAAALVVLHHTGSIMSQPRFYGAHPFGGLFQNFNVGVDFFFVLSGFIITWVHWRDIGVPERLPVYAWRRFVRVFPPYWGVVIPLIILYQLFPSAGLDSQRDPLNIAFSLTLLPYPLMPVLGVAWTLVREVLFYTIFGLAILMGGRWLWLLPIWGIAIVAAQFAGELSYPWAIFLDAFNIEFLFGIATALWLRSRNAPMPWLLLFAGIAVFLVGLVFLRDIQSVSLAGRLYFGLASVAILMGLVELERSGRLVWPSALRFFGASSYSIYLVHPVALSLAVHLVSRILPKDLPVLAPVILLALAGITGGLVYHAIVERPLIQWLRTRVGSGSGTAKPSLGAVAPQAKEVK